MKKILSMALALVMALSLVTFQPVSAEAAFTDAADITYTEAVDVISSLKIMEGYADGSFGPGTGLTRQAAAKIICCLLLTPATANNMPKEGSQFTDVQSGTTFAGFISYCYNQGIIGGYGGGRFGPTNGLTGYAFLKMLLGTLGYNADLEHYSGSGWQTNVWTQASLIGLTNGIQNFDGNAQVTREVACQMAFNTLQANMVEYTGTSVNTRRVRTSSEAAASNISTAQSGGSNILQFAEEHFPRLVKIGGTEDAFGRPATGWTLNGSSIGTYQARAARTYYGDVTTGTLYEDLGMSVSSSNVTLYLNGVKDEGASITIARNGSANLSAASTAAAAAIGPGCEIQVFQDDSNAVTICVVTWYAGTIESVKAATTSAARSVNVAAAPGEGLSPAGFSGNGAFETASFTTGDRVAYTFSGRNNTVQAVTPLTPNEGSLDRYVTGTSVTLSGSTYTYAKKMSFGGGLTGEGGLTSGTSYVAYVLRINGQNILFWLEGVAAAVDGYALVLDVDAGNRFNSPRAALLFSTGSESTVTLDKAFSATNVIVRYSISGSTYALTQLSAAESAVSDDTFSIDNRTATGLGLYNDSPIIADNATVFVVQQGDSYSVYTGIRNVPNVSGGAKAYTYHDSGTAKIVFITGGTTTTTNRELTFIAANSASNLTHDTTSANGYRTFNAVIGGRITTVRVEAGIELDSTLGNDGYKAANSVLLDNVSSNSAGIIVAGSYTSNTIPSGKLTGISAPTSGGQITIGGARYALADNAAVWYVNPQGTIRSSNRADISADSSVTVLYTVNDGEVSNLFILEA